ncbi:hypothetical protein K402DRAFT_452469 [Aulographum hederae CBS 113979]|uniref:Uncharacterized protein n=1 Tax=Aulographum hederae CBS 113979 TaxID=1176131 RepID=A0A6G1H6R0_9PEZI|nr:hypothetical protein K402DRAFT_452469 [Aulographum hederae CBS 113979]
MIVRRIRSSCLVCKQLLHHTRRARVSTSSTAPKQVNIQPSSASAAINNHGINPKGVERANLSKIRRHEKDVEALLHIKSSRPSTSALVGSFEHTVFPLKLHLELPSPSPIDHVTPIDPHHDRLEEPDSRQLFLYRRRKRQGLDQGQNDDHTPGENFTATAFLILRTSRDVREIRMAIRYLLTVSTTVRSILRVLACCMQRPLAAEHFTRLYTYLEEALYGAREFERDIRILLGINMIITRFRIAGLPVAQPLLDLGIRFAARSRSVKAMKRYLREFKKIGEIRPGLFRSVVAKFSIGYRGFGEIRNGRWKRGDLLQVLLGFRDLKEGEEPCHLGVFMVRELWDHWSNWVAALARYKAKEEVWKEWEWWRDRRRRTEVLEGKGSRTRRDIWIVGQLVHSGHVGVAWRAFEETGLNFGICIPGRKASCLTTSKRQRCGMITSK